MFYLFAFYSTFSVYFILPDFFILFSTFSGTHVRMCVQVAMPLFMSILDVFKKKLTVVADEMVIKGNDNVVR